MTELQNQIIENAKTYVRDLMKNESSGHDYFHANRVLNTALLLAKEEGADEFTVSLAALLHDADDRKLSPETYQNKDRAAAFLRKNGVEETKIRDILTIIEQVSFKGTDTVAPDTVEGKCVQDADRLDALGAIGIARTFAYGGSRGRQMHDPEVLPKTEMTEEEYRKSDSTSLNHFYEKLFKLKALMNTAAAKRLAAKREDYMKAFVTEFIEEWNGIK